MKAFAIVTFHFLAILAPAHADSKLLPVLNHRVGTRTIAAGQGQTLQLSDFFGMEPIDDEVVRFTSGFILGGVPMVLDFAIFSERTPITRTNFLNYTNSGAFDYSFIHRSVPGFVIQGGGFVLNSGVQNVPTDTPIVNEFGISNTLGTIAMAKVGGDPDSATSQWFVNLGQNSGNLDEQNGGFTVFARMTKSTFDYAEIFGNTSAGYFPVYDIRSRLSQPEDVATSPFGAVPLNGYTPGGSLSGSNFILFTDVSLQPLPDGQAGEDATLTYTVSSDNSSLVAVEVQSDGELQITTTPGASGNSTITITATDSVGNEITEAFTVSVTEKETYQGWRQRVFSELDSRNDAVSGPALELANGLTNLQLFAYGLQPNSQSQDPVKFGSSGSNSSPLPSYTFPIRNDISGVTYVIEKSSDLGASDSWTVVDWLEKSRVTNGEIDLITLESPSAVTDFPIFYRVRFSAP